MILFIELLETLEFRSLRFPGESHLQIVLVNAEDIVRVESINITPWPNQKRTSRLMYLGVSLSVYSRLNWIESIRIGYRYS